MKDKILDVEAALHAKYPIILLKTYEEAVAEKMLLDICANATNPALTSPWSVDVIRWRVTRPPEQLKLSDDGRVVATPYPQIKEKRALDDFLDIVRENKTESALYILRDAHQYLKDPYVQRQLRDLASELPLSPSAGRHRRFLVMISPHCEIPAGLEKDIYSIDLGLPSESELAVAVQGLASSRISRKIPLGNLADPTFRKGLTQAGLGLTSGEFSNVLAKSNFLHGEPRAEDIHSEKKSVVSRSGVLEFIDVVPKPETVGGLENLKRWLEQRKSAFSVKAVEYGLPSPKGLLAVGLPGTGKSLLCKAIGGFWDMPVLRLDMGRVFGGLVGESEANMRKVIDTAEAVAPVVLWLN